MVCVLSSAITSKCSGNSHVSDETLHNGENGGRSLIAGAVWALEAGGAVTNITTYRDPPRGAGKGPAVSMWISSIGLLARAVV